VEFLYVGAQVSPLREDKTALFEESKEIGILIWADFVVPLNTIEPCLADKPCRFQGHRVADCCRAEIHPSVSLFVTCIDPGDPAHFGCKFRQISVQTLSRLKVVVNQASTPIDPTNVEERLADSMLVQPIRKPHQVLPILPSEVPGVSKPQAVLALVNDRASFADPSWVQPIVKDRRNQENDKCPTQTSPGWTSSLLLFEHHLQ